MCADIFGKEMEVDQQSQSSLMGGVVLAMELLGVIDTIEDFNVEPTAIIVPNPERIAIYKKRYACYKEYYEKF